MLLKCQIKGFKRMTHPASCLRMTLGLNYNHKGTTAHHRDLIQGWSEPPTQQFRKEQQREKNQHLCK